MQLIASAASFFLVLQLAVIIHAAPFDSDTVYHCDLGAGSPQCTKGYSCCGPIIDGVGGTCYYAGGSEDFNCPMY